MCGLMLPLTSIRGKIIKKLGVIAMTFRVAVLQMRSVNREYERNIKTIIKYMSDAKQNGADILLLPECFITGYDLTIDNASAITENDLAPLCENAKELNIGLVATALTQGKSNPQNSAFVISKDGKILMKYAKVHTCDFADEKVLESGTEFKVCDFDGVKIGIMICYDREYPESARVLMLKGAEIILVPNDCGSMRPRLQALSTRAYENMCGVAMANERTPATPVHIVRFAGIGTANVLTIPCCLPMPKQRDCFTLILIWTPFVHTVNVK